jgi:hypothetical protein
MLKCTMACAAEIVLEAKDSNNLTLVQVLEAIQAQTFPLVLPKLSAVFYLAKDLTDADTASLKLRASVGPVSIIEQGVDVGFAGRPTTRLVASFVGFPVPQLGTLLFELLNADAVLGAWPIEVQTVPRLTVGNMTVDAPATPATGGPESSHSA